MNDRFKNPYFWFGLVGVILAAMGVTPEMFTSWELVGQKLMELISNPFMIGSVIIAITGVFVDPTTRGIMDCKQKRGDK